MSCCASDVHLRLCTGAGQGTSLQIVSPCLYIAFYVGALRERCCVLETKHLWWSPRLTDPTRRSWCALHVQGGMANASDNISVSNFGTSMNVMQSQDHTYLKVDLRNYQAISREIIGGIWQIRTICSSNTLVCAGKGTVNWL